MTLSLPWTEVVSLEGVPSAARAARLALAPLLATSGLPAAGADALQVAVGEAVANAVENGLAAPQDRITIRFRRPASRVEVSIHSPLDGWDLADAGSPLPAGPYSSQSIASARLHLIRTLVDGLEVLREGGTKVILIVLLSTIRT